MLTALGLLSVGRPRDAHRYAEQALIFEKDDASALNCSSLANVALGHFEEGIAAAQRAVALSHGGPHFVGLLGWALATAGRKDEARALLDDLRAQPAGAPAIVSEGWLLGALGEIDAAFEVFARAEDGYQGWLVCSRLPGFDPVRADPRFPALLERLGLPPSPADAVASSGAAKIEVPHRSIVVLPFANLSPDPDTEYFSDGLTDEIITDLSRVRALRVISRSSAMRLKDDERGLAAIGRDLDCRYVLEGSVRRAANTLRITARLVDAPEDIQLWSDKYGGTLDDVFDIQERVSRSIVDALEIQLTPEEAEQLAERPIDDIRAQESYFRARNEIWSFMPGSLDLAISHLEAALQLVGDNALIYQGLGEAYFQYVNIGAATGREEEFIQKAESCVDKIFVLEPESPRGYLVRAQVRMARGNIHDCSRDFQRVLQVYPNEIMALALYTHVLGWLGGKPDAAAVVAARLVDIDPLNPMSRLVSAMVPMFAGRFSEAVEATRRMFDLDPVTPVWRANHVMALSYARRFDEAEALTDTVNAQPDSDVGTWQMGLFRAAWREDRAEVLRLADGPYQQVAEWDAEVPWLLACAHAAVGAADEALHWLERAIDHGMINYPFLSEHDWYLDSIRGEERFARAIERARGEWERLDEVLP
jgi:TolB-like protein/Flp pilus assembly protein TadD